MTATAATVATTVPPFWQLDRSQLTDWLHSRSSLSTDEIQRLCDRLDALRPVVIDQDESNHDDDESNNSNRRNKKRKFSTLLLQYHDPYHIWTQGHANNNNSNNNNSNNHNNRDRDDTTNDNPSIVTVDEELPTHPGGILAQLTRPGLANALESVNETRVRTLHREVANQVRQDVLRTTPQRIRNLLCPDLSNEELVAIQKRVHETVVLGKGLHADETTQSLALGHLSNVHDIEKFKKCQNCQNTNQANFVLDRKNGDVICSDCGTVVSESLMHEGSAYRKFEGEEDRNHHGDAANPLFSQAHNLSTTLSGVAATVGAGKGGWGSAGKHNNLETILRNAHAYTELNISQFGQNDKRTRVGYKDQQKREAFAQMVHVGDALNLHEAVVQRAKELFAGFRDDRELVQQFKGVLAACLVQAFEQLSREGRVLLKEETQETKTTLEEEELQDPALLHKRAQRRNELHHANLAGKVGGWDVASAKNHDDGNSTQEDKVASAWELDDCRSWLLNASRRIAQEWKQQRDASTGPTQIPAGSLEDLEGILVEHSIRLSEFLESELKAQQSSSKQSHHGKTITPRVSDMSKLGIQWQHESRKAGNGSKTAGQILILMTAKKLGSVLGDTLAGDSFHKELRALAGRQETKKLKLKREEASRQRLQQMKRKPWLQARLQS